MRGGSSATELAASYRRATVMQATCAAVGLPPSIGAWLAGATVWWLIAGVLLGLIMPFTLIVILPAEVKAKELTQELSRRLEQVGWSNAYRS